MKKHHPTCEELDRLFVSDKLGVGGSFGGGSSGGSTSIVEDPDTLQSTAYAKIKDAICEGEIFGLANPDFPMTCVAFDGTPVERGTPASTTSAHLIGYLVTACGTGYMAGDVLTAVGGVFTSPVTFVIDTAGAGGSICFGDGAAKHVTDNGSYTTLPPNPVSFSGGSGTGAKINITWSGAPGSNAPYTMGGNNIFAGGTGYAVDDVLTATGGTPTAPVQIKATNVISGAIVGFSVIDNGSYDVVPSNPVSFSGGGGSGFKLNIFWLGSGFNFTNFTFYFLNGKQHQSYLPGFDAQDDTFAVGVILVHAVPWVQTLTDPDLDEIQVSILFPQMESQDASTGAIHGTSVALTIEIQSDGGGFVLVTSDTVTGKASSPYVKTYGILLAGVGPPPWDVRVTRVTADSTSSLLHNATEIENFTQIIYGKLSHPNTALAGTIIDAKQFAAIPSRAFLLKGLIVKVPMNYDPDTRTYAIDGPGTTMGTWDGTFKLAWTNNPAWCFYDMCTNERYGLGKFLMEDNVSKFDLYGIAQYCDEMVPNGFGGFEPRFACSLYLQRQEDAMKVVSDMASIFRGLVFFQKGMIIPTQDKPSDVEFLFSPANVVNGQFTYSGTSKRARHTVAHVVYNDMTDFAKLKPAVFEDSEQILKFGYNPLNLTAFGCNSLGQALRLGKWAIRVEKALTDTVSFTAGQEGFLVQPGKVIQVQDPFRYQADYSGRLTGSTTTTLLLDRKITLVAGRQTFVSFIRPSDSVPITIEVLNVPGSLPNLLTDSLVVAAMAEQPTDGTIWQVAWAGRPPEKFRVLAMTPKDDATCDITGLIYDPSIYVGLDDDPPGDPPDISAPVKQLDMPRYVQPPSDIVFNEYVVDQEIGPQRLLSITWTASPDEFVRGYLVKVRYESGTWDFAPEVPTAHVTIPLHASGTYEVKVYAMNYRAYQSKPAEASYTSMVGGPVAADMAGGDYTGNVVLTSEIPSAVIYYTTDGSDPTDETNMGRTIYSAPVAVAPPLTLKASAKRRGRYTAISQFDYSTTACGLPTFSPVPDPHFPLTDPVSLALATTTAGADVYYTDDGTTPDNTSTLYSAPFSLDIGSTIIKAVAIKAGLTDSPIAVGHFHVRAAD